MKIPKKLKIGGLIWSVEENKDIANESDCFGSTHYRKQKIFLEPDENQQKKEQVLLHEIAHVIFNQCGYSERMKDVQGVKEEELIKMFSCGFYQVLKDNNLLK